MCRRLGCEYDVYVPEALVGDSPVGQGRLRPVRRAASGSDAGGTVPAMTGRDKSYWQQVAETVLVCAVFGIVWLLGYWVSR